MSITITERGPGVFDVRVRPGRHRPPHYFRHRGTRAEAQAAGEKWQRQTGLRPLEPNATLGAWLRHLIASAYDLSPRTLTTYRCHVDNWIDPARVTGRGRHPGGWSIGAMRLRDVQPDDAGAFIVHAKDKLGISNRTMRDSMRIMRWAFSQAMAFGMVQSNPFQHVRLPRAERRPPSTPVLNDLRRLAECPDPRTRLLLILAAFTGARRGELLALTWENIDLRARTMTIGASLDQQRGKAPELKEPKTASGRRTIELPAIAVSELRLARLQVDRRGRRIEDVPVLPDSDGHWWTPEAASQAALRALRALKVPGSLHTLRHAHATLLLGQGKIAAHLVARRLGHANVTHTLDIYAHAIPADDKLAADAIDGLFDQQRGATGGTR